MFLIVLVYAWSQEVGMRDTPKTAILGVSRGRNVGVPIPLGSWRCGTLKGSA